jgi:hypothetical protein
MRAPPGRACTVNPDQHRKENYAMKRLIITTAIALALAAPAQAALVCNMTDRAGNKQTSFFLLKDTAERADGVIAGTYIESGITKNGVDTNLLAIGQENVWTFTYTQENGIIMLPQGHLGLTLVTKNDKAALFDKKDTVARGECRYVDPKDVQAFAASHPQ